LKLWSSLVKLIFVMFLGLNLRADPPRPVTPEIRTKAEEVILHCENLYLKVAQSRKRLENIKYNLYLKTFDSLFFDFTSVTNIKILIRLARTAPEMAELLEPYSSNCMRFGQGLLGFVDWSLGLKNPVYDKIYTQWVKDNER